MMHYSPARQLKNVRTAEGATAANAADVIVGMKGGAEKHAITSTSSTIRHFDSSAHRPTLNRIGTGSTSIKLRPKTFRGLVHSVLEFGFYVDVEDHDGDVVQKWRRLKMKDGLGTYAVLAKIVEVSVLILIILNVVLVLVATDSQVLANKGFQKFFSSVEYFSFGFFTLEYLARLWTCVENPEIGVLGPVVGRFRWMFNLFPLIDLVALAAYPAEFFSANELGVGKVLRSSRIVRVILLLRIERNAKALSVLANVLRSRRSDLHMSLFILITLFVVSSTMMYYTVWPSRQNRSIKNGGVYLT